MNLNKLLNKKISTLKKKKKNVVKYLKIFDKIRYYMEQLIPDKYLTTQFTVIKNYGQTIRLMEKLREFLWTTPLFTHTIHSPTEKELKYKLLSKDESEDDFDQQSTNSILLTLINRFERLQGFKFDDVVINTEDAVEAAEGLSVVARQISDDVCEKCDGVGKFFFETQNHTLGIPMTTYKLCEHCWGSGRKQKSGVDLKHLKFLSDFYKKATGS